LTTNDVQYTHSTLDWITGLLTTVTSGVFSTKRIIADNIFDPAFFMRLVEEHQITWVLQVPAQMAMMANSPAFGTSDLSSLRYYLFGGSRASVETQHLIRGRLSEDCLHFAYGFTELGSMASINFHFDEKPNSVGRLVTGMKLKVIGENGESLGPDEVGELCLCNDQYWAGYYGNPEETHKMRDPQMWFHSGDLGFVDDDGFIFIVERKKDMLKYQNIMYYPNDIESVISEMPDVAEVCVLIFCDGDEFEKVRAATAQLNVKIITMRNHPLDSIRIDEILATPIEENFRPARLEQGNDQTLAILCSSGTTGIPKAVTITNSRQILNCNQ